MKWGTFAGAAAESAVGTAKAISGLQTAADARQTAEQNRQQSATKMLWEKEKHELEKAYYDKMDRLIKGQMTPTDFYGSLSSMPASGAAVQAQTPVTTSSSSLGAAGGLASY